MKLASSISIGRVRISVFFAIAVVVASTGGALELPEQVGRWPWGPSHAVAYGRFHAFFGSGAMLQVVDVHELGEPVVVGNIELPDLIRGLWSTGDHLFVAADDAGLRILDVRTPAQPIEIGSLVTDDPAFAVTVAGDYAYLVDRDRLLIVDITDLRNPVEVGRLELAGDLRAVVVRGALAYVAGGSTGLHIVEIWAPAAPERLSTYQIDGGYVLGLAVQGRHAYVAARSAGFRVLDVWDPLHIIEIGSDQGWGDAYDVVLHGDGAYVAYYHNGILRYYMGDPSNPYRHYGLISGGPAVDLDKSEELLFSASLHGSFRTNPLEIGVGMAGIDTYGNLDSGCAQGGVVAALSGNDGLQLVDASDPHDLVDLGKDQTSGGARKVVVSEGIAAVLVPPRRLQVVDLSALDEPTVIVRADILADARDLVLDDKTALVADGTEGLKLISLADPSSPELLAAVDTPGTALDVAASGGFAYVADGTSGLRVVDLLGRRHPVVLKNRTIGEGGAAAQNSSQAWPPGSPVEIGRLDDGGYALAVEVDERYVYLLDHGFGFRVIEAKNPYRPVEVGRVQVEGWGEKLAIAGSCAFVSTTFFETLKVIDFSEPSAPVIAAELPMLDQVVDLWVEGELLYVGQSSTGFLIYDISGCL